MLVVTTRAPYTGFDSARVAVSIRRVLGGMTREAITTSDLR